MQSSPNTAFNLFQHQVSPNVVNRTPNQNKKCSVNCCAKNVLIFETCQTRKWTPTRSQSVLKISNVARANLRGLQKKNGLSKNNLLDDRFPARRLLRSFNWRVLTSHDVWGQWWQSQSQIAEMSQLWKPKGSWIFRIWKAAFQGFELPMLLWLRLDFTS